MHSGRETWMLLKSHCAPPTREVSTGTPRRAQEEVLLSFVLVLVLVLVARVITSLDKFELKIRQTLIALVSPHLTLGKITDSRGWAVVSTLTTAHGSF